MTDLDSQKEFEHADKISTEEIQQLVFKEMERFRDELVRMIQYRELGDEVMSEIHEGRVREIIFLETEETVELIGLYLLSNENPLTVEELVDFGWQKIRNDYGNQLGKKHKQRFYTTLSLYVRWLLECLPRYLIKVIDDQELLEGVDRYDTEKLTSLAREKEDLQSEIGGRIQAIKKQITKKAQEAISGEEQITRNRRGQPNLKVSTLEDGKYRVGEEFSFPWIDEDPIKDSAGVVIPKGAEIEVTQEPEENRIKITYRGCRMYCPVKYEVAAYNLIKIV